ncbi:hypothetical protein H2200_000568 [Cladophialophora chaetospira]|uniref:Uncharacterized protein n=1 Tax=Cladophialophora chaetospira TaxID=386627 RepID=A0AA38XNP7_9EURO|nr:hypothetical protein H2200_000568 [Cladophialophora chaetospira]
MPTLRIFARDDLLPKLKQALKILSPTTIQEVEAALESGTEPTLIQINAIRAPALVLNNSLRNEPIRLFKVTPKEIPPNFDFRTLFPENQKAQDATGIVECLSIFRGGSLFPCRPRPAKMPGRPAMDWIRHIDYGAPKHADWPEKVFLLGHLVVKGQRTNPHHVTVTPSWFAVVVDVAHAQKPVWLVGDRYFLGWVIRDPSEDDDWDELEDDDYAMADRSDGKIYEPPLHDIREREPDDFFRDLPKNPSDPANDVDLIRLFPSLDEWDIARSEEVAKQQLFSEHNRFVAKPRIRHAFAM